MRIRSDLAMGDLLYGSISGGEEGLSLLRTRRHRDVQSRLAVVKFKLARTYHLRPCNPVVPERTMGWAEQQAKTAMGETGGASRNE